jgi:hypothetical protein
MANMSKIRIALASALALGALLAAGVSHHDQAPRATHAAAAQFRSSGAPETCCDDE